MFNRLLLASALAVVWPTLSARAQQEHATHERAAPAAPRAAPSEQTVQDATAEPQVGPHQGSLHQVGEVQFESVMEPGGLKVFAFDRQGEPLDLRSARGVATLQVEGDAKRYRYDLFPEVQQDESAESLAVAVDLRRMAGRTVELKFQVVGLPGTERRPASFAASAVAPLSQEQQVAAAIAAQNLCPVSGQPLGSMGGAIAVTVGEETIYVCCEGCIDAVKENPAKYLAKLTPQPVAKPVVVKTTKADAEFVAAQKLCPVMDEPLNAMGGPYKTTIEGQVVYLCCPGCAKKLYANPGEYLAKLSEQGVTPPPAK